MKNDQIDRGIEKCNEEMANLAPEIPNGNNDYFIYSKISELLEALKEPEEGGIPVEELFDGIRWAREHNYIPRKDAPKYCMIRYKKLHTGMRGNNEMPIIKLRPECEEK